MLLSLLCASLHLTSSNPANFNRPFPSRIYNFDVGTSTFNQKEIHSSESEPQLQQGWEPKSDSEPKSKSEPESELELEPETESAPELNHGLEPKSNSELEHKSKTESEPELEENMNQIQLRLSPKHASW